MCLERFSKTNIPPALPNLKQVLLLKEKRKSQLPQLKGKVAKFRHKFCSRVTRQDSGKLKFPNSESESHVWED